MVVERKRIDRRKAHLPLATLSINTTELQQRSKKEHFFDEKLQSRVEKILAECIEADGSVPKKRLEPGWKSTYASSLSRRSPTKRIRDKEIESVFQQARKPVKLLERELHACSKEKRRLARTNNCGQRYEEINKKISDLEFSILPRARKMAKDKVWGEMNPRPIEFYKDQRQTEGVLLKADFHGLYVEEALDRFDVFIRPKLSDNFRRAELIVGSGGHCARGVEPQLKFALMEHAKNLGFRAWMNEYNPGVLVVVV